MLLNAFGSKIQTEVVGMAKVIGKVAYRKNAADVIVTLMNPSKSSNRMYRTLVYSNGSISCNCPGWTKNANRECCHTKDAKSKIRLAA